MLMRGVQAGVSLVELMIGLLIVSIVLLVAVPAFTIFIQNTKVRNAAETTLAGIGAARAEAIRRNAPVRFQLVSDLTNTCALSASSLTWIVSLADPTNLCATAPSETVAPQILQKKAGSEGSENVAIATTGGASIIFNGLGRVTGTGITQLDFSSTTGTCEHLDTTNGKMRCLRVLVSTGGAAKLCDPKVTAATDPRLCI